MSVLAPSPPVTEPQPITDELRVQRGAALLDDHVLDWRDRINVDLLDLMRSDVCILGQVFGDYNDGLDWLHNITGSWGDSGDFGFTNNTWRGDSTWRSLEAAWRAELGETA